MNSEHMNTNWPAQIPDDAWDVFLPEGEDEPLPDEGDFWFEPIDSDED